MSSYTSTEKFDSLRFIQTDHLKEPVQKSIQSLCVDPIYNSMINQY